MNAAPFTPADLGTLDDARSAALRKLVRVGLTVCVLATLAVLPWLVPAGRFDVLAVCAAAVLAATVFALVPIPLRLLAPLEVGAMEAAGVALALTDGPTPVTFLMFALGHTLASVLLDLRGLVATVAGGLTLLVVVAAANTAGGADPWPWFSGFVATAAVSLIVAFIGQTTVRSLRASLARSAELVAQLRAEASAREHALQELGAAQRRLTHGQKLELLGQLAGGVAHDMNNALTVVIGEASLLDDSMADTRAHILDAAEQATQLTRQLLLLGRRDTAQPRVLDLVETVRAAARPARRLIPSEIILEQRYPPGPLHVRADPVQLTQVVLNLAVNARDAMVGGGTLTLEVDQTGPEGARRARLVVRDTGHGIDPGALPHLFEPFFTTKEPGQGTGLGLANVREIVESLGGSIRVESQPGHGAAFFVELPVAKAPPAEAVRRDTAPVRGWGRVLVVEDDIRVRAVACTLLARAGYAVFEAGEGRAAIALAEAESAGFDLVVTDVVMPHTGGADVLRWFQQHQPATRLLVVSGYPADEMVRRGITTGAYPFLAKPYTAEDFLVAVATALLRGAPAPPVHDHVV